MWHIGKKDSLELDFDGTFFFSWKEYTIIKRVGL